MDWFNWQNNLSNNISNRPDFGFTQTDTLSLNTTYNHFVSWDFAQPGKPCGGMSPGPRPPRPPTEPPTTTTNIGCDESAASPQQEGMWNYNSKHSRGNLFIPRSCMSDLGESLITKVGFELYIPKEIQQSINFVGDWPSSKEWKVEGVDMWIFMHTTADKYPTLFNGLNILVTGVIDDYNKPIPSTTEKAYMDGIKNHTQVLNNGILSFTQADVLDGLLVQQPTGLSDPETRGYYKKYVYFDLEIPYAYDGLSSLSVNINTKGPTLPADSLNYIKWGVANRVNNGVIDNNPGIFGHKFGNLYSTNTSVEVNRSPVPKISLVTTTNTTTVVYKDKNSNGVEGYREDIPLDFSSKITFSQIPFSEQIILNSELKPLGLNGKTIIGIKYIFKNSLSGTNSNGGNGEKYTLDNQKLTIRYTTDSYYEIDGAGADSHIIPKEHGTLLRDCSFSLVLDNINDGAVKIDTTPQDFYIYFDEFKLDITDQSQNIVLIWENKSLTNANTVIDGGMSTLGINIESSDDISYKVYTYYRRIIDGAFSETWEQQRLNEIPIISFIYKD